MIWGLVGLVIQSDMSPKAIVQIWGNTTQVFTGFHVPIVDQKLIEIVHENILTELLSNLNNAIGSSSLTCIDGG
jgi:hypothetical protein